MESEANRKIREVLEKYLVSTNGDMPLNDKVIDGYNLIGALSSLFYEMREEHYQRMASMINSYGFIQYLLGNYELKDKKDTEENRNAWADIHPSSQ